MIRYTNGLLLILLILLAFAAPVAAQYQTGTRAVVLDDPIEMLNYSADTVAQHDPERWGAVSLWERGVPFETVAASFTLHTFGDCTTRVFMRKPGTTTEGVLVAEGRGIFQVPAQPIRYAQVEILFASEGPACIVRLSLNGILLP